MSVNKAKAVSELLGLGSGGGELHGQGVAGERDPLGHRRDRRPAG